LLHHHDDRSSLLRWTRPGARSPLQGRVREQRVIQCAQPVSGNDNAFTSTGMDHITQSESFTQRNQNAAGPFHEQAIATRGSSVKVRADGRKRDFLVMFSRRDERGHRLRKPVRVHFLETEFSVLGGEKHARIRPAARTKGLHRKRVYPVGAQMPQEERGEYCFSHTGVRAGNEYELSSHAVKLSPRGSRAWS
jgi:hypothetical protein